MYGTVPTVIYGVNEEEEIVEILESRIWILEHIPQYSSAQWLLSTEVNFWDNLHNIAAQWSTEKTKD